MKNLNARSTKWSSNIRTLWSRGLRSSMEKPPPMMSAAAVEEFPHDIIFEVLTRLPAKSLCRFKCVCKLWNSTISDPGFLECCRMGSQFWLGCNYLVIFWFYRDEIVVNFEHHDDGIRRHKVPPPLKLRLNQSVDGRNLEISPPLNGLVCLYSLQIRHALILNIKIQQIIHLPMIVADCGTISICCDQITGEYKVLHIYRTPDPDPRLESAIYTLNGSESDSSWRKTMDPPQLNHLDTSAPRPCDNGTVYWLIVGVSTTYLICFEVYSEAFRTLRFTETLNYNANVLVVGSDWSACFPLVCPHFVANGVFVPTEIWLLEECREFNQVSIKEKVSLPRTFSLESPWRHVYSDKLPTGELFIVDCRTTRKFYVDLKKKRYDIRWSYPRQGKYLCPYPHIVLQNYVENMYRFEDRDNGRHSLNSFMQ